MAFKPAKHGRDHCPGGEDPIPCLRPPWIVLTNGAREAADSTWVDVPFNDAYWDPKLTTPGNSADDGPFELLEITIEGSPHYELKTWIPGWYRYHARILWDQVTTPGDDLGCAAMRIVMSGSMFFQNEDDERASADWNATDYLNGQFEMLNNPWLKDADLIYVPGPRTWNFQARQDTGLERGLTGDVLKVWFMGPDDDANWATSTAGA